MKIITVIDKEIHGFYKNNENNIGMKRREKARHINYELPTPSATGSLSPAQDSTQ